MRVVIDEVKFLSNGGLLEPDVQHINLRFLVCRFVRPKNASSEGNLWATLHLPPSISLIWNLQTLQINGDYVNIVAPAEIWKMSQLRHLIVRRLCLPNPRMDDPILHNLLTLEQVDNFSLSDDVCKRIPNIKRLDLVYYFLRECDESSMYYYPQNLGCLHKLESLRISFFGNPRRYHFARDLTIPSSLQKLVLENFPLRLDDLTMISSLPHLVHLELWNSVHDSKWITVEMGFPCLRFLMIYSCRSLVSWNVESSHFPVLDYLHLMEALKLDEIPSGIGDIPTLKCITMQNCSDSAVISAARILVEQQELGNDALYVEVWFQKKEELQRVTEMLREEGLSCYNLYLKL